MRHTGGDRYQVTVQVDQDPLAPDGVMATTLARGTAGRRAWRTFCFCARAIAEARARFRSPGHPGHGRRLRLPPGWLRPQPAPLGSRAPPSSPSSTPPPSTPNATPRPRWSTTAPRSSSCGSRRTTRRTSSAARCATAKASSASCFTRACGASRSALPASLSPHSFHPHPQTPLNRLRSDSTKNLSHTGSSHAPTLWRTAESIVDRASHPPMISEAPLQDHSAHGGGQHDRYIRVPRLRFLRSAAVREREIQGHPA